MSVFYLQDLLEDDPYQQLNLNQSKPEISLEEALSRYLPEFNFTKILGSQLASHELSIVDEKYRLSIFKGYDIDHSTYVLHIFNQKAIWKEYHFDEIHFIRGNLFKFLGKLLNVSYGTSIFWSTERRNRQEVFILGLLKMDSSMTDKGSLSFPDTAGNLSYPKDSK